MFRFILFVLLTLILYAVLHTLIKDMPSLRKKMNRGTEPEELVQDPYCQTYIPEQSAIKKKIGGHLFHFCGQDCLNHFLQNKS